MRNQLLVFLLSLLPFTVLGQTDTDSLEQPRKWYVPVAATVQYAGNMGMLSAGPGYEFVNEKLAIDVLYGYVPKFQGTEAGHLLTLKSTYKPFKLAINEKYALTPVQFGLGVSYHFGDKYSLSWEDPFPKGYYWWSTRVRVLGFAGTSVNRTIQNSFVKDIGAFAELGTYDLLVTAWYKDDKLRFWDILSASAGVRVRF